MKVNLNIDEGVKNGENKLEFSQTSKGFWYCANLTIYCENPLEAIKKSDEIITKIDQMLFRFNRAKEKIESI